MKYSIGGRVRRLAAAGAAVAAASLALAGGALADAPSNPGTFVIGDQNVQVGGQVTFWGAQWWQDNPLSTGLAPASFKGFVVYGTPSCDQPWTTDPGNSSHPPATVSGVIPVIVSSQISKSGPVISGDTTAVALVQVDPGYAGDPGHPGTGTVIGFQCGGPDDGPPAT
jgi:hypothetical protein